MNRITEGAAEPLGVAIDDGGANIAVYSAHARAIDLCLFDDTGVESERIRLAHRSGAVHHAHVAGLREGQRYGLRAYGSFDPSRGHRFDAAKLLVDPFALALDRPFALHASQFEPGADSAAHVPKAIATRPRAAAATGPRIARRDAVIYEAHVRGFTKTLHGVPDALRGTFAGLAHDAAIAHFTKLGVTTLELMPCAAWVDERHLPPLGLSNYWGYNPIAFCAPDPRLAPGGWAEVAAAVARLHEAGLQVIVDVVLNHSGESDEHGPTLSMRGLDNASYYRMSADDPSRYVNDAGCGNILAADRAIVVRLMTDALRAWVIYGGVDGFRFDLATTLGRRPQGFDPEAPLLAAIMQDPALRECVLIAEPWDLGPGGYQLGNFPAGFAEWNDRFRDCARRFWRGDDVGVSELATRFSGSEDVFGKHGRPSASINFITAHDGFTLADLVSFTHKHNDSNGEDNCDGTNDNLSWNNGAEGASDDAAVRAARAGDQRALLATLLLSRGTPMLSMGAEMGQSQGGNNNAYAQDNAIAWLDWARADESLVDFTAELIALRKANPALACDRFLDGAAHDASLLPDVEWLSPAGAPLHEDDWRDPRGETLIASLYACAEHEKANRVVVAFHRGRDVIALTLPAPREGFSWRRALDSAIAPTPEGMLAPRSVALFTETRDHAATRRDTAATPALLESLAAAAGIATRWRDVDGAEHAVPRETIESLLATMGLPARTQTQGRDSLARRGEIDDRRLLPESLALREGAPMRLRLFPRGGRTPSRLRLRREDGREETIALADPQPLRWRGVDGRMNDGVSALLPPLPPGRHLLTGEQGDSPCRVTVAPPRCHFPPDMPRSFGYAAQLYALRSAQDQGIGDFSTLTELAQRAAESGAALLALNPFHALFPQKRDRASPYYPSDRRFLEPLYIDLHALPGDMLGAQELADIVRLRETALIDYPGVHALKTRVLEKAFAAFDDLSRRRLETALDFDAFVARGGAALRRFAAFQAIGETHGADWRNWPNELRAGHGAAVVAFSAAHETRVRYHLFLQYIAESQLDAAAATARAAGLAQGFCRDLAVGSAPDGAESWSRQARLLTGFSVGAPPDAFSRNGQVWGLPPANPLTQRADGGADFAELVAANMRFAGALRIDHVMGLSRLFVVPDGGRPADGAYLAGPADALFAQLALESARSQCLVLGEDLGTIPWGFRETLERERLLSYRVLWFERDGAGFAPPHAYPAQAMACVSTHDLPTLAGWWAEADIEEKAALGLIDAEGAAAERRARGADKAALLTALRQEGLLAEGAGSTFDDALARALHGYAAKTPSLLAMAQLDDLAGESVAVNLPGTDAERPNWRRKLTPAVGALFESPRARAIIAGLRRNLV